MNPHRSTAGNGVHRTTRLLLAIATAITLTVVIACSGEEPPPTDRPEKDQQKLAQTIEAATGQLTALQTETADSQDTANGDRQIATTQPTSAMTTQTPPTARDHQSGPIKREGLNDNATGQRPEWIQFFTKDPKVLAYRWYRGENCPSGHYSHRDDLYIFDSEEALSPIEVQERDLEGKIIGSKGFHSTGGHICLALSEEITPASYTALHELAHAIAYSEYGLTGHNTIHTETLIKLALEFEKADCSTKDGDLLTLIEWNRIQLVWGDKGDTPPNDALTSLLRPVKSSQHHAYGAAVGTHLHEGTHGDSATPRGPDSSPPLRHQQHSQRRQKPSN